MKKILIAITLVLVTMLSVKNGDKDHYYAGEIVPEPYASIYFPLK